MENELLRTICERLASLEVGLRMHLEEHFRMWLLMIPIIAGVFINLFLSFTMHKNIKKNGNKL